MLSIICIYNNYDIFHNCLLESLNKQNISYELIGLDNTNGKYTSAAFALKEGISLSTSEFLCFAHQDIIFLANNTLAEIDNFLKSTEGQYVAGVAGVDNQGRFFSNIIHGIPPIPVGTFRIHNICSVETVDECLFFTRKDAFININFDDTICDDWHLYAVDLCLQALKMNYNIFVLPIKLHHISQGSPMLFFYYKTLFNVVKKHKKNHKYINTTVGIWPTNVILLFFRIITIESKKITKKILGENIYNTIKKIIVFFNKR